MKKRRGQSAARLKALRRQYGLGEFAKRTGSKPRRKSSRARSGNRLRSNKLGL